MAATGDERGQEMTTAETTTKEGANLLGKPKFKKLDNGRFRCVQTGHELVEKDKEVYSQSKRCRLGLINHALSHNKPPLNLFEQDPDSRSKLLCKLTGDKVNKTEEHIWKHINGRRFLNKLEEKEREKESGSVPKEGEEAVKEDGINEEKNKKKKNKKKKEKKKKKKNMNSDEKNDGENKADGVEHDKDEDVAEELDFWMPPDGERWDFDDGGDRWGSDSDPEEEMNGEEDPIGEAEEDGKNSSDGCITDEIIEDGKNSSDETPTRKRKSEEVSSNGISTKKKKKKKSKKDKKISTQV